METSNSELHDNSTETTGEDQNGLGIEHSEKPIRQKKILIALPFIIIPCLLFGFWMLRSDSDTTSADSLAINNKVNTTLPDPILDKSLSKREIYEQADREADLRQSNLRSDPYADQLLREDSLSSSNSFERSLTDRTDRLNRKLSAFSEQMADVKQTDIALGASSQTKTPSTKTPASSSSPLSAPYDSRVAAMATEEDRKIAEIEAKMAQLDRYGSGPSSASPAEPFSSEPLSPEDSLAAAQLQTLDKIMERATMLRFPELAEDEMRKRSLANQEQAYPISQSSASDREVRYFGSAVTDTSQIIVPRGGFYTDQQANDAFEQITVGAQVHSSVTVVEGSTVKLRLLDDVFVAGLRIPKHSFVYATTSLNGDRLRIQVETINFGGNIYQVKLEGFDLDGLPGIAVPGSVERQIAKRQASQTARTVGGGARTNNLATQLAVEGTDAVKEIASRKLSVTKIYLKSGHQIILRNRG